MLLTAEILDAELRVAIDNTPTLFHAIWLRDHCHCAECYHPVTRQRLVDIRDIPEDLALASAGAADGVVRIVWSDGHTTELTQQFLRLHSYNPPLTAAVDRIPLLKPVLPITLWDVAAISAAPPTVDYAAVMDTEEGLKEYVTKVWQYGFCLVKGVPANPEDTERLVVRLNYIRPTHYGGFWDFTLDLLVNDTAYTNIAIPLHADGTYWTEAPGLQLFHLLLHEGTGGDTLLVDAFACARQFKQAHPDLYRLLATVPVPAHLAGEDGVCVQPTYSHPIFVEDATGELVQVRWNQSDRSTLLHPSTFSKLAPAQVPLFYQALRTWAATVHNPKNEWYLRLEPGVCLMFDNWRVLHLRTAFTGKRRMCGAYIGRDEFMSALKRGYDQEELGESL